MRNLFHRGWRWRSRDDFVALCRIVLDAFRGIVGLQAVADQSTNHGAGAVAAAADDLRPMRGLQHRHGCSAAREGSAESNCSYKFQLVQAVLLLSDNVSSGKYLVAEAIERALVASLL